MGVQVSGVNGVLARCDLVVTNTRAQANAAIGTAVKATFDGSQNDCPVDKGDLKASGTSETHDLGGSVTYGTDHCWYPELGTVKMPAHPYLFPNYTLASDQLKRDLTQVKP